MKNLENSVALITGATSGMGLATARRMKELGATVILSGRKESALKRAKEETGADASLVLDVTKYEHWEQARDEIAARFGCPDILVNNAGTGVAIVPFMDYSMDQIHQAIDVNLYGAIYGCRAFAPLMKERGSGLIVNVLSVCASHAWPGYAMYSAAKAGLKMFAKCLYLQLQPYGVRITSFIPGACNTNFGANAGAENNTMAFNGEDVAEAIGALCQLNDRCFTEEFTLWSTEQQTPML